MNLARTRHGSMIHTRDCRFAVNATPWLWADDKRIEEIIHTCEYFGYQTCIACRPFGAFIIRKSSKRYRP